MRRVREQRAAGQAKDRANGGKAGQQNWPDQAQAKKSSENMLAVASHALADDVNVRAAAVCAKKAR
jgi:hypothetical protein